MTPGFPVLPARGRGVQSQKAWHSGAGVCPGRRGVAFSCVASRASVPPHRASGARLRVSGGGSMAAGAAVAAEAAAAVAEVGSARQFEELLRLKAKYAGRLAGRGTFGRRAGSSGPGGGAPVRHVRSRARGPTAAALAWPWRDRSGRAAQRGAAAPVCIGPASRRPACGSLPKDRPRWRPGLF